MTSSAFNGGTFRTPWWRASSRQRSGRATLSSLATFSALASSPSSSEAKGPATTAAASSGRLLRIGDRSPSNVFRERRRAVEEEQLELLVTKSNDDDALTVVPLHPFGLRLSNLPSASPVLLALGEPSTTEEGIGSPSVVLDGPAMRALLQYVSDLGASAFRGSRAYGERFEEWDVGSILSLGGDGTSDSDELVFSTSSATLPLAEMSRMPSDDAGDGDGILGIFHRGRRLFQDAPLGSTAVLTMGHEGTVTFEDMYWEDAPESQELTDFLVREMNLDASREGLLEKLRPLACRAEDVTAGECDVEVEVVSSDAIVIVVDDSVIVVDDGGTQDVATMEDGGVSVEPKPLVDGITGGEEAENLGEIDATGPNTAYTTEDDLILDDAPPALGPDFGEQASDSNSEPASPDDHQEDSNIGTSDSGNPSDFLEAKPPSKGVAASAQEPAVNGSDINSNLKTNIAAAIGAAVVGVALLASLVAVFLYRRKRRRRRAPADDGDGPFRGDDPLSFDAGAKSRELAEDPAVVSAKSLCGGSWAPAAAGTTAAVPPLRPAGDSSAAATAGASVATASSLAAAAGAPNTNKTQNTHNNGLPGSNSRYNDSAAYELAMGGNVTEATRSIDEILKRFSDGDSSFVSDTSSCSKQQSVAESLLGSLAGLLGGSSSSATVSEDPAPRADSRISADVSVGSDGVAYLPKGLSKVGRIGGDGGAPANASVQRQESFEGTYRALSAMHQLNLKKDMLHGDNRGAGGTAGEDGTARRGRHMNGEETTLPKAPQQGRDDEKGERTMEGRDQESSEAGLAVPAGFDRSESIQLVSWSEGSSSSGGDTILSSGDDSRGAFPSALV